MSKGHPVKRMVARTAAVVAVLLAGLLLYGTVVEPRFIPDDRRYQAEIPGLPQQWEGAEVAVFSDLQIGMWWDSPGMVERIVARTVQEDPAAALIAGDFLYSSSPGIDQQVDTVIGLLQPLVDAQIPTFAVLGNHDYAVSAAQELTTALQDAGVTVLRNEAAQIPPQEGLIDPGALYVVGIGPPEPGRTDADQALSDLPVGAARVVLTHNPTIFPRLPAASAPLAVAGHTHCGQIAIPGTPRWSYVGLTQEERIVADGWAPENYGAQHNSMFVTCGIGFSRVPVRIGAAPQLVIFELTHGS